MKPSIALGCPGIFLSESSCSQSCLVHSTTVTQDSPQRCLSCSSHWSHLLLGPHRRGLSPFCGVSMHACVQAAGASTAEARLQHVQLPSTRKLGYSHASVALCILAVHGVMYMLTRACVASKAVLTKDLSIPPTPDFKDQSEESCHLHKHACAVSLLGVVTSFHTLQSGVCSQS